MEKITVFSFCTVLLRSSTPIRLDFVLLLLCRLLLKFKLSVKVLPYWHK